MSVYRELDPPFDAGATCLPEETQLALIDAVARGELIVLPTDTVYGIGSDPFSKRAVGRLLGAKGRDETMPPPVLGGIFEELVSLVSFPTLHLRDNFVRLAQVFWPGELTIVAPCGVGLGWDTDEVGNTVALRMPGDALALEALRITGPLAVTSANRTGMPPACTVEEARDYFGDEVRVYVDGGSARAAIPSTIVDCSTERPRVLRQGGVSREQICEALES